MRKWREAVCGNIEGRWMRSREFSENVDVKIGKILCHCGTLQCQLWSIVKVIFKPCEARSITPNPPASPIFLLSFISTKKKAIIAIDNDFPSSGTILSTGRNWHGHFTRVPWSDIGYLFDYIFEHTGLNGVQLALLSVVVIWLEQIKVAHINLHTNASGESTKRGKSFSALRRAGERLVERGAVITCFPHYLLGHQVLAIFFPSYVVFVEMRDVSCFLDYFSSFLFGISGRIVSVMFLWLCIYIHSTLNKTWQGGME